MSHERSPVPCHDSDDRVGRRRSVRQYIQAEVRFGQNGKRTRVRLLDLSCHGARLNLIHALKLGDTFWVTLPGLAPLSATVTRADGFIAGCEFVEPLHPAAFDNIMNGSPRSKTVDRRKPKLAI